MSAFKRLLKSAKKGDIHDQVQVGACYVQGNYFGEAVPVDYRKAIYWFERAESAGSSNALYNLGVCCERGWGVPKDMDKAIYYYEKGAKGGFDEAQYRLGTIYLYGSGGVEKDFKNAVYWLEKAAFREKPHIDALMELGVCYYRGWGVPKDYGKSLQYTAKAADMGQEQAQHNLKVLYAGLSKAENSEQAVEWLEIAAEEGNADAQFYLGRCYHYGYGVPKNPIKVVKLMKKAADKNQKEALEFIAEHQDLNFSGYTSVVYNVDGDVIQNNKGIIAKDEAVVNRSNVNLGDTSYCSKCGAPIPPESIFCSKCGAKVR